MNLGAITRNNSGKADICFAEGLLAMINKFISFEIAPGSSLVFNLQRERPDNEEAGAETQRLSKRSA